MQAEAIYKTIPRVPGLPGIGVGLSLVGDPEAKLQRWYDKYGPVFRFKAAHFDYVCMAGTEANIFANGAGKDLLLARPFWLPAVTELGSPNTVMSLDGKDHKIVRKVMSPPLSRRVVEESIPDVVQIVCDNLDPIADGRNVPFVHASQKLSSNIVGHLMMDMVPDDAQLDEFFTFANTLMVTLLVLRLPAAALKLGGARFRHARAVAFALIDKVVAEAVSRPMGGRRLLVDVLLEARKEHPELFTEGDIQSTGFLAFFAGIDTMGQTLAFALWELLRNPAQLQQVQAEVDALFSQCDGVPTAENLRTDMPLTMGAYLEALRLHPTGFGVVRQAADDFVFQGYSIPKGQDILLYTTLTHHQPELYPNPRQFDIERFQPPRLEHRQKGAYAPYGRGPHTCAGAAWAESQAMLMLGTILFRYDVSMDDSMRKLKKKMRTTPTLGKEFKLRFERRN